MNQNGLMHIYYGYGKGKTTAALGLALRALGYGKQVTLVQFLKNRSTGEIQALERFPHMRILRGQAGKVFARKMSEEEKEQTRCIHNANLKKAMEGLDECDLLILDECLDAYQLGLLDAELLKELIAFQPRTFELVLTGHKPEEWLNEKADYVTFMQKIKHPYEKGIAGRKGIEF